MLGPVVVLREHREVAGLEPGGVLLPGAQVVVLVVIDGEDVDGEQPRRERDDPHRDDGGR
jgi:hypothetical protein